MNLSVCLYLFKKNSTLLKSVFFFDKTRQKNINLERPWKKKQTNKHKQTKLNKNIRLNNRITASWNTEIY